MFTRAYGEGALFQMSALDAEESPNGNVLEDAMTFAAADLTLYSDEIGAAALTAESVAFTSGSTKPSVGDTLTGATSAATAVVIGVVLTSGSWSGGDAAGTLFVEQVSGTFQSENLDNTTTSASNVMTIGGDIGGVAAASIGKSVWVALTSTEMACQYGNVEIVDATATQVWLDFTFPFETYGNASALHPVAEVELADGALTAAKIASDAITAAKIATDAIGSDELAASALAAIQAELEEDGASILDTLRDRLTSARATALDEITAARLGELDAANIPADIDTALTRLTAARAGYLDNLNIGELVAGTSEVTAIQNNTRVVRVVPDVIERETRTYRVELFLYDAEGNMEAPDSAPTIELVDQDGTDLSARLDSTTMTLVETGRYRAVYTSDAAHDTEQLLWVFSVTEGGATRKYGNRSIIVDTIAVDFTAADRTKLEAINSAATEARLAELDAANLPADLDAVLADTGELVGDWEDGGRLDLLLDGLVTQIDTARSEPGQGAPPVSAKMAEKIDYLYKFLRNKSDQTDDTFQLYADDGSTVDQKRTISEDGTTAEFGEVVTGP